MTSSFIYKERMKALYHTNPMVPNRCSLMLTRSIDARLPVVWWARSVREVMVAIGLPARRSTELLERLDDDRPVIVVQSRLRDPRSLGSSALLLHAFFLLVKHESNSLDRLQHLVDYKTKTSFKQCISWKMVTLLTTKTHEVRNVVSVGDLVGNSGGARGFVCFGGPLGFFLDEEDGGVNASPDGDIIDCVPFHLQPAFDHSLLKGQKTITKPPKAPSSDNTFAENFQVWTMSGERCLDNTIPIRRTTAKDILKANFGRKIVRKMQYAFGIASGIFHGVNATINVWRPHVANSDEFSLAQIWVASEDLDGAVNAMEAGWQITFNRFMVTIMFASSSIGLPTIIIKQVVTICFAQALFKPANTSYLELQFGIIQLIMAHNITLLYLLKR
ncbi:hypothetical protein STAS_28936 [Striga asiatica]|uniref:Neprosin PEP catalytic domain-containing protein n=1 Tax=Striga asiatica TaxID=4170 RepID=A0A5A7R1F1_STRAF|nr:hypothetical protein STAS_28936 [Striga asiatica]